MNNTTLVVGPKPIYYKKANFNSCLVCNKSSKKGFDISLHAFPKNKARRAIWLQKCGLVEEDIKHNRKLCCSHFKKNCIKTTGTRILLKKNAVPVIFEKEIKIKKTKKQSQTEAMLQNVQVDDFENSAADVKPLEGLFQFTEESSEAMLQNVQVDDFENSAADVQPLKGLFQFTEESSENSLIGLFGDVLWNSPFPYFPIPRHSTSTP